MKVPKSIDQNSFDPTKANTRESEILHTTPVNRYDRFASGFGICDLAGNVEEWVQDTYAPYPGGWYIVDDFVVSLGLKYRILRGGSFAGEGDLSRCARRNGCHLSALYQYTGFRIVYST